MVSMEMVANNNAPVASPPSVSRTMGRVCVTWATLGPAALRVGSHGNRGSNGSNCARIECGDIKRLAVGDPPLPYHCRMP